MDRHDEKAAAFPDNEYTEHAVDAKHEQVDESDGKIQWSRNQIIAIISLSALWTGMSG